MSRKLFRTIVLASVTTASSMVFAGGWDGPTFVIPMPPPATRPSEADMNTVADAQAAVVAAQRELAVARAESVNAQATFKRVTRELRSELETGNQMARARGAVSMAKAEYDAATAPVLASLAQRADYREACAARARAEQVAADVRAHAGASTSERVAASQALLDAKSAVARLENCAFDSSRVVANARAEYVVAVEGMWNVRRQLDEKMDLDPRYLPAQQAVADAQDWVIAAERELAVAKQNLDAAQSRYTAKQTARQDVVDWAKNHGLPEPP